MEQPPRVTARIFIDSIQTKLPTSTPHSNTITGIIQSMLAVNINDNTGNLTDFLVCKGTEIMEAANYFEKPDPKLGQKKMVIHRTYDNGREWVDGKHGAVFECKDAGLTYFLGMSQN